MNRIAYLIIAVFLLGSCKEAEVKENKSKTFVKSEVVKSINSSGAHLFHGVVEEKDDVTLSFRVGGPINTLKVDVGDYVAKGELIASIDERDYRIQERQTESLLTQRKAEYERYTELFEKGKLPENTFDQAKMSLEQSQVAYDQAINQLNDTKLYAPFSGYISEVMMDNYETAGPGTPIVSLIDISNMHITLHVPASQLSIFEDHIQVKANIESIDERLVEMNVKSVGHKAGPDDLYEVLLELDGIANTAIRPGMSAEVQVSPTTQQAECMSIPVSALLTDGNDHSVWVIDGKTHTVKRKHVKISEFGAGARVYITKGLTLNDRIVTAGVHSLNEGQHVEVITETSTTNIGGLL